MTTTGKVFLSCAFGSGIGALVALSLWQPIWWLGMLVGGLVGYISYGFKAVIAAIPVAWQTATTQAQRITLAKTWNVIAYVIAFLTFAITTLTIPSFLLWLTIDSPRESPLQIIAAFSLLGLMIGLVASIVFTHTRVLDNRVGLGRFILRYNILTVYSRALFRVLAWGVRVAKQTPSAVATAAVVGRRFSWHLFIEIHSEMRLLCGLDAAIGAGVGYFFGHALIGIVAGGILGVVNYELVSRHWLHIVPSR